MQIILGADGRYFPPVAGFECSSACPEEKRTADSLSRIRGAGQRNWFESQSDPHGNAPRSQITAGLSVAILSESNTRITTADPWSSSFRARWLRIDRTHCAYIITPYAYTKHPRCAVPVRADWVAFRYAAPAGTLVVHDGVGPALEDYSIEPPA